MADEKKLTEKDYFLLGVDACANLFAEMLHANPKEIMGALRLPRKTFDRIASEQWDKHKEEFIKSYLKMHEAAETAPTQPEGNA